MSLIATSLLANPSIVSSNTIGLPSLSVSLIPETASTEDIDVWEFSSDCSSNLKPFSINCSFV